MTNHILRDEKRRKLFNKYETIRKQLKAIFENTSLPLAIRQEAYLKLNKLPRNSAVSRVRRRCVITGRGRAVYQDFKLSRLAFRELASNGYLMGVKKASW